MELDDLVRRAAGEARAAVAGSRGEPIASVRRRIAVSRLLAFGLGAGVVIAAIGLVALAGGGGGGVDLSPPVANTATTATTVSATVPDDATLGDVDPGDDGELTLEDFIPGAVAFDENTDWQAIEMDIQQQVAECMAAEGFEYIPFVPSDVGGGAVEAQADYEQHVRAYGWGISTRVLQEQDAEEAIREGDLEDSSTADPNLAIIEAMDETEQEEYHRVLYGGRADPLAGYTDEELAAMTQEEMNALVVETVEPSGCYDEAAAAAYEPSDVSDAFWEEFDQDYEDLFSGVDSDPRFAEADAEWSACMADKGYDFANQDEMNAYFQGDANGPGEFQQRLEAIMGSAYADGSSEGEGSEYDMEELQPLIDEEIATATADFECSQALSAARQEIYDAYEQLFIEENLDRLVAFKEANS